MGLISKLKKQGMAVTHILQSQEQACKKLKGVPEMVVTHLL
jgi:hypothetical protein